MVEVEYMIFGGDDPYAPVTREPWKFLSDSWAGCEGNGRAVAEAIAEHHFDNELWAEYIGDHDGCGEVLVSITAPPEVKGVYRALLARPVKARCEAFDGARLVHFLAAQSARVGFKVTA